MKKRLYVPCQLYLKMFRIAEKPGKDSGGY